MPVAATKIHDGDPFPQKFRSHLERVRYRELLYPRRLTEEKFVRVKDLKYEPRYAFHIDNIQVASYQPDFVYKEEVVIQEEVELRPARPGDLFDIYSLDRFEIKETSVSEMTVSDEVKGEVIEPHSVLKLQMLVALHPEINEGRLVVTGSRGSQIAKVFKKEHFIVENQEEFLTQIANSQLEETIKLQKAKEWLNRTQRNNRVAEIEDFDFEWLKALEQAKQNGQIQNYWLAPEITPVLGRLKVFLKPYRPFCIYENRRGKLYVVHSRGFSLTKEDWLRINVINLLLKDVVEMARVYFEGVLVEEWCGSLPTKYGVKPKHPPLCSPSQELTRGSFFDVAA